MKSGFFNTFLIFPPNIFFCPILTFFKLWIQTRKKRRQKSKNVVRKCILHLNFALIKGYVFLIFFKKSQIRCTLRRGGGGGGVMWLSNCCIIPLFPYFWFSAGRCINILYILTTVCVTTPATTGLSRRVPIFPLPLGKFSPTVYIF